MLKLILDSLKKKGVVDIIVTLKQLQDLNNNTPGFDISFVEDVRSAVFNAYGMAKTSHTPTVVIVDDAYLPNTYTALTEAWFQRVPVIVISLNSTNLEGSWYLKRCIDAEYFVDDSTKLKEIADDVIKHKGPALIKMSETLNEECIDYSRIQQILTGVDGNEKVLCYNSSVQLEGFENIKHEYKYGILSKYVGRLVGGEKSILCIPEEILALDTNIFNFRDFPNGFRLLVKYLDGFYWDKIGKWLESNNIKVAVVEQEATCLPVNINDSNFKVFGSVGSIAFRFSSKYVFFFIAQ